MDNKNAFLYRIIQGYGKTAGKLRLANQSGGIPVLHRFSNYGQVIKCNINELCSLIYFRRQALLMGLLHAVTICEKEP